MLKLHVNIQEDFGRFSTISNWKFLSKVVITSFIPTSDIPSGHIFQLGMDFQLGT